MEKEQSLREAGGHNFNTLKLFFFGFIVGIAAILPGLSGGILAIALGVYAPAVDALISIRHNFKKSCAFLIPLGIGVALGLLLFGIIMKPLLENYERTIIWLFSGLIIGSIPSLLKEATKKGFRILYLIPALVAFTLGMLISGAVETNIYNAHVTPLLIFIGGGVLALGMIIPGISSSFILLQMGLYDKIISAFVGLDFYFIMWTVLGAAVFALITIKLISIAFNRWHGYAYFAAFGFLLSTLISVFPRSGTPIDIIFFIVGIIAVYIFMKKTAK